MSRDLEYLTYHEKRRLDYLHSNYHYLNEREQLEYNYLLKKSQGAFVEETDTPRAFEEEEVPDELEEVRGEIAEPIGDLPVYQSRSQKSKKNAAVPPQNQPKKPRKKVRVKRILKWIALFFLLIIGGMVFMFVKGLNSKPTGPDAKPAVVEKFNNNKEGKIKMVSFMRDTLVHIDGVSQQNIPGYDGYYDQKLNTAFTIGEQNNNQGAELVRQMLKDNFDIDIQYYAMVDFKTFATAIDTLFPNGVEMDAKFSTINGEKVSEVEVPDDLNMKDGVVPQQTIKVGKQRMDGRTLLNYSRFRKDDEGDFGRTRRQQEVMSAIMHQIKDPTKLFTGSEALGKVFAMTSTNVPFSFLLTNGIGLVGSAGKGMERVTIPENGDWVDAYDMYGGQGLLVDFDAYKKKLYQMGLR